MFLQDLKKFLEMYNARKERQNSNVNQ